MSKKITIWHNGAKKMSFVVTGEQNYNDNTLSADGLVQSLVYISQSLCSGLYCEVEDLCISDHDKVITGIQAEKELRMTQIQDEQDKRQLEIQF